MLSKKNRIEKETFTRRKNLHPRLHAKSLDKEFGYKISKIEVKLLQKYRAYDKCADISSKKGHFQESQTWIGLHPQALQTTYNEIYETLDLLSQRKINKIVDIGCGYGRVGVVMSSIFPNSSFIGYEILKKRADEGNRVFEKLGLDQCRISHQNVLDQDFRLPDAEVYFIYDFSEREDIRIMLDQLSKKLDHKRFYLITKGERVDSLLTKQYQEFWKTKGFIKSGDLKIYCSHSEVHNYKVR